MFSHVLRLDMCSKMVMLVSAACIGLLIGTVRPIPGSCANQVIIFVEKRGSVAIPFKEFVEHVEGLPLHLAA